MKFEIEVYPRQGKWTFDIRRIHIGPNGRQLPAIESLNTVHPFSDSPEEALEQGKQEAHNVKKRIEYHERQRARHEKHIVEV